MDFQQILQSYQKEQQPTKAQKSERAEIVKKFVDRLNEDRIKSGYKPLPASVYAIKMAETGLKTNSDLYWFWGFCNDAKHFSKCWWGTMKEQKKK